MTEWPFFTQQELECRCGCGQDFMDPDFMQKVVRLRTKLGFAFPVTSGYRCPTHNALVSTTGSSGPHTQGLALDIGIAYDLATILIREALNSGFIGVGISQKGPIATRFVHIDIAPRRSQVIWTY